MPLNFPRSAIMPRRKRRERNVVFNGFPHGLNTNLPAFQIAQTELSECVNWMINKDGKLESRRPFVAHTTTATESNASIVAFENIVIGGTERELIVDENKKVYYNNSGTTTRIGSKVLESASVVITGYMGVAIILDGGYIKYCDGITDIKIAYDDGTGTNGYQYNNSAGDVDSTLALGNGTNVRIAAKFTSQTWTSGYTIPPTTVTAKLSKTGTPNASAITVKLRLVSDDSVLASKELVSDATTVAGTATEYSVTFTSSDITTEMSQNTSYYLTLEHSGGDGSNYINVHCTDVASGGVAYYYTTSYNADTTKDPIVSIRPGRPPKGSFSGIKDRDIFIGGDPDNPGWVWAGGNTYLDWSTSGSAGYIGAIDESASNFEIGGIENIYDVLYVFGTSSQPYLCKLTGTSMSDYALDPIYQRPWTSDKLLKSTSNDLWFANNDGVSALSGVEQFGDVRTFTYSDQVNDRIVDYFDKSTAYAAYYPLTGQYLLCMPTYHRLLVFHTRCPFLSSIDRYTRYPCTEYEYTKNIFTSSTYKWTASGSGTNEYYVELSGGGDPSINTQPDFILLDGKKCSEGTAGSLEDHEWDYGDNDSLGYNTLYFCDGTGDPDTSGCDIRSIFLPTYMTSVGSDLYLCGSDGFVYKIDVAEYKDLTVYHPRYDIRTKYIRFPYRYVNFRRYQHSIDADAGALMTMNIYRNDSQNDVAVTKSLTLNIDDRLTVGDMIMDVRDAYFLIDPVNSPVFGSLNFNARSFQVQITDTYLSGYPLHISGFMFTYRILE
jgi:hypothetical protein